MKYIIITLSSAFIILLICFIVCQQEIRIYEDIIKEEDSLFVELVSLDSLEKLAYSVSDRNKLRHQHDLKQIDSLKSVCRTIIHTQEDHSDLDIYASEVATTTIKDTIIYRKKFKDTTIYKPNYVYLDDTVYKTIEIVDTIYRRVRQRRNNN